MNNEGLNIKKVKVESIWIAPEEKEVTAGEKSNNPGKKYKLIDVSIKVADDSKEYAGERLFGAVFASEKNSATNNANYFKTQNEGKDLLVKVSSFTKMKDGEEKTSLNFKIPTKEDKKKLLESLM